jgi:hypothetical protein
MPRRTSSNSLDLPARVARKHLRAPWQRAAAQQPT